MRPIVALLLLAAALVPGAAADPAPARRGKTAAHTAEARTAEVKQDRGIRRYDPALFGPEQPLPQVIRKLGLPTENGRLLNARVLVLKHERRLELYAGDRMVKAYRVQLGPRPVGDKLKVKDGRTPEGTYRICSHTRGKYHRELLISYPNAFDAERALMDGRITAAEAAAIRSADDAGRCTPQNTRLGGWIMLHGQAPSLTSWLARAQRKGQLSIERGQQLGDGNPPTLDEVWDWTQGCIALLNPDIRELSDALPDGTRVEIRAGGVPTRPSL